MPRLWVTVAPELQRFCQRLDDQDLAERLKRYLGLKPTAANNMIVEMWVAPDDLFRPCPDPKITNSACTLKTPDPPPTAKNILELPPSVKNIPDYWHFLLALHEQSYREDGAPWTGLGYTYDWAHGNRGIGASEYLIVPNVSYGIRSVQPLSSYCASGPTPLPHRPS
jgi:hypothetical protein